MNDIAMPPEMSALKTRLKATWESGDYGHFATYLLPGALEFLDRLPIGPGIKMLDVACGAGQIAFPAARKGAQVTGIDLADNLVKQARKRAEAEQLPVRFEQGDAEDLPYENDSFDLVVSLIGAMFAPRPELVARELVRVCKPGGRLVMANWTPEGFVGQLLKTIGKHVPPPSIMPPPPKWGDEPTVRERLKDGVAELSITRRMYPFSYPFGPRKVAEFYCEYYGPSNRAYASLDEPKRAALLGDLEALWSQHNKATDGGTKYDGEYLEVVAIRA
ncbi:MAG: class I SAM-dependent methyltransferase [Bacteroidota bacterium]